MAEALRALHTRKPPIIHRDIKSPNILMVSFNPFHQVVCKVADFGESRTGKIARLLTLSVAAKIIGRENLGNPLWLAPEVMKDNTEYDEKADIFSLGIVMGAELLRRAPPYEEHEVARGQFTYKFEDAIIEGKRA